MPFYICFILYTGSVISSPTNRPYLSVTYFVSSDNNSVSLTLCIINIPLLRMFNSFFQTVALGLEFLISTRCFTSLRNESFVVEPYTTFPPRFYLQIKINVPTFPVSDREKSFVQSERRSETSRLYDESASGAVVSSVLFYFRLPASSGCFQQLFTRNVPVSRGFATTLNRPGVFHGE